MPARLMVALVLAAAVAAPSATTAASTKPPQITVMTRNLFLGADLIPLAVAQPGDDFEHAAGAVLDQVTAGEPTERMKLVAGEIAKAKPDLVGLQEVTIWKTGPKNDQAPATNTVID